MEDEESEQWSFAQWVWKQSRAGCFLNTASIKWFLIYCRCQRAKQKNNSLTLTDKTAKRTKQQLCFLNLPSQRQLPSTSFSAGWTHPETVCLWWPHSSHCCGASGHHKRVSRDGPARPAAGWTGKRGAWEPWVTAHLQATRDHRGNEWLMSDRGKWNSIIKTKTSVLTLH